MYNIKCTQFSEHYATLSISFEESFSLWWWKEEVIGFKMKCFFSGT